MEALKNEKEKLDRNRELLGDEFQNPHNLVFTNDYGKNLVRRTVVKHYKKVLQRGEVQENRFHDLQHSFAVNSLTAGDNIKNVQANLGHATSALTMEVYCHVSEAICRESAVKTQQFYESVKPAQIAVQKAGKGKHKRKTILIHRRTRDILYNWVQKVTNIKKNTLFS